MCLLYNSISWIRCDNQKKELEAELANVTGTAKPTRKIRYFSAYSFTLNLSFVYLSRF